MPLSNRNDMVRAMLLLAAWHHAEDAWRRWNRKPEDGSPRG